jgi:hypothetical protein
MWEEGDREAMVGMLTLYDAQGERQHTNYFGTTPQHGKADVTVRVEREVRSASRGVTETSLRGRTL